MVSDEGTKAAIPGSNSEDKDASSLAQINAN